MEKLRKQLDAECNYRMSDQTMDTFLGLMTRFELKRHKALIPYDKVDDNVYVVKEGIIRIAYFDGLREVTFGFGLPGTLLISYFGLGEGQPAFCKLVACCDSVVMKVSKADFFDLVARSHDFARWMVAMSLNQLLHHEKKLQVVNGDAKERLDSLVEHRPEIIENVSSRIVASYIGITPQYLSALKRTLANKSKK